MKIAVLLVIAAILLLSQGQIMQLSFGRQNSYSSNRNSLFGGATVNIPILRNYDDTGYVYNGGYTNVAGGSTYSRGSSFDPDTTLVLNFFIKNNVSVDTQSDLYRGIRFGDLVVGKRNTSNGFFTTNEYYIEQWATSSDSRYNLSGRTFTTRFIADLMTELSDIINGSKYVY